MSVFFVFLILCLFDKKNLAVGKISKSQEALQTTYMQLQEVGTGYQLDITYTRDELSELTEPAVETKVKRLCHNIVCSYLFMAVHHLRMLEYFVGASTKRSIPFTTLFFEQAQKMLTVAYSFADIPENTMRAMWIVYTYELYLESVCFKEIELCKEGFPDVHRAVVAKLQESADGDCKPNNIFNDLYERSDFHKQLESVAEHPKPASIERTIFIHNRTMINDYIRRHEKALRLTDTDEKRFSHSAIYLNRLFERDDVMIKILRRFGEQAADSDDKAMLIKNQFSEVMGQYGLDRWAQRLGDFLDKFVDLLKIIMLRTVCMHVVHLEHVIFTRYNAAWWSGIKHMVTPLLLLNSNKYIITILNDFVGYLDLNGDPHLKYVINIFSQPSLNFLSSGMRCKIINEIASRINELCKVFPHLKMSCPTTLEDTSNHNYVEILRLANAEQLPKSNRVETIREPMMQNSTKIAYLYVEYIKKMLVGVDIKVFKSFIEFTRIIEAIFVN